MSVSVMAQVWEHSTQKANKLLLLLALADIADDHGWAYPAQNTLARKCRIGRRAVQKLLDELEATGEVVIYNRFDPAHPEQHFSNVYHLPRYGAQDAPIPQELRGVIRKRGGGSEQPDVRGVANGDTGGGSEQPDTTVANSRTLGSEQPDTRVVNSGSHESLQDSSGYLSPEPEKITPLVDGVPAGMPEPIPKTTVEYSPEIAKALFQQAVERSNGNEQQALSESDLQANIQQMVARYGGAKST